jgi:C_GCAxxG_C_C family probable redox protein
MTTITEKAISNFRDGLNCAQAVLTAYSADMNFDNNLALSIACGFGGGMGRLQKTCGAATGSFMVMGVYNCRKYTDNKERKEMTYAMVQEFSRRFKEAHGTLNCHKLLNCDMKTEEGKQYIKDHNLHEVICERCIADSVKFIGEIMH